MDLQDYRRELDTLDDGLLELFCRRMEIAAKIGAYKKEKGLPVLDASREREKLLDIAKKSPEGMEDYTVSLFSLIMELSRSCQNRLNGTENALTEQIREAIDSTPQLFPPMATVACQGAEEDASRFACDRLFKLPNILGFSSFDAVFSAVEKGLCQYGVVPVENSAGVWQISAIWYKAAFSFCGAAILCNTECAISWTAAQTVCVWLIPSRSVMFWRSGLKNPSRFGARGLKSTGTGDTRRRASINAS